MDDKIHNYIVYDVVVVVVKVSQQASWMMNSMHFNKCTIHITVNWKQESIRLVFVVISSFQFAIAFKCNSIRFVHLFCFFFLLLLLLVLFFTNLILLTIKYDKQQYNYIFNSIIASTVHAILNILFGIFVWILVIDFTAEYPLLAVPSFQLKMEMLNLLWIYLWWLSSLIEKTHKNVMDCVCELSYGLMNDSRRNIQTNK